MICWQNDLLFCLLTREGGSKANTIYAHTSHSKKLSSNSYVCFLFLDYVKQHGGNVFHSAFNPFFATRPTHFGSFTFYISLVACNSVTYFLTHISPALHECVWLLLCRSERIRIWWTTVRPGSVWTLVRNKGLKRCPQFLLTTTSNGHIAPGSTDTIVIIFNEQQSTKGEHCREKASKNKKDCIYTFVLLYNACMYFYVLRCHKIRFSNQVRLMDKLIFHFTPFSFFPPVFVFTCVYLSYDGVGASGAAGRPVPCSIMASSTFQVASTLNAIDIRENWLSFLPPWYKLGVQFAKQTVSK